MNEPTKKQPVKQTFIRTLGNQTSVRFRLVPDKVPVHEHRVIHLAGALHDHEAVAADQLRTLGDVGPLGARFL